MKKASCLVCAVIMLISVFCVLMSQEAPAQWTPQQTISLIVPWGAGGATDQTCRTLASEMEPVLGEKIAVINQPGASGATGQQSAFDAPHDGHTWAGNADSSVATYQLLDLTPNIPYDAWQGYFAIFTPCVICVNPDSEITDWESLIEAFTTRDVPVASAGIGAGGHIAAETFVKNVDEVDGYKHVPYKGGNPAVVATVAGETEVVMQLSMEVADMLRADKLRAIAVMDSKPLTISGVDPIPAITDYVPDFPSVGFNFGLFIPEDIPEDAAEAIGKAFDVASQSEAIKKLADSKGSVQVSIRGDEADKVMDNAASLVGWLFYETGVAEKSPEEFGIPKP
ncbi:tripartite tricarboxylate transporter substrate binding protein [candidate division KSB3 bacterium]|uniref:Tripartite tricarboxylate transporter substrate binding protein n=1 Tax=candidate division KSB3 bacterium TaxID=2044937 RepID=A0A9D5JZT4_9BACT|nr:tripartite tricarboxylate transporter substrate binding protein [candidate division KSB3 bacterium]MBD3327259.1 tripartite tricarboxylate transporter substrate binding protein [candidate division KSB3 bacterium]